LLDKVFCCCRAKRMPATAATINVHELAPADDPIQASFSRSPSSDSNNPEQKSKMQTTVNREVLDNFRNSRKQMVDQMLENHMTV